MLCKLFRLDVEYGASQHEDCIGSLGARISERVLNIFQSRHIQILNLHFERGGSEFGLFESLGVARVARSAEDRYSGESGNDFLQELQPLFR